MLVLTRGPGQSVVVAGSIVVTVLSARGSSVRLGIEAPAGVLVRRSELPPQSRPSGLSTDTALEGHDSDGIGTPESKPRRIPR